MTPQEFAQKIKSKYPQYAGVEDADLARKVVAKYPQYAREVNFEQVSKDDNQSKIVGIANAVTSSERALGHTIGDIASFNLYGDEIKKAQQQMSDSDLAYIKALKSNRDKAIAEGRDTSRYDNILKNFHTSTGTPMTELFPSLAKSDSQVLGEIAGTALDLLSVGSYGQALKDAKLLTQTGKFGDIIGNSGKLLVKPGGVIENIAIKTGLPTAEKAAVTVAKGMTAPLVQTLKQIGKKTAVRSTVGGVTGYAYDVSENLKDNKTGVEALTPGYGTLLGAGVPATIGGIEAAIAITKASAPKFINSLIKPKTANFAYGKDPGRTVSELGITGNNLDDFANNIGEERKRIGSEIGGIYGNEVNSKLVLNVEPEIAKIDDAINGLSKGGKNNQSIVSTLQNIKDALLYEHAVNPDGVIEKTGTKIDLTKLNPEQAFNLKQKVASLTQFKGIPSDDKAVNSVLKSVYGSLSDKLTTAVGKANPEINKLNQQFSDLVSAEIATKNRDAIVRRSDLVSMPVKVGTAAGFITAVTTGGAAIPALLAGTSAALLDKALQSTAVKTRIAAWLGSESPSLISKVLKQNPSIKTVLYRALPKFASQLGQES